MEPGLSLVEGPHFQLMSKPLRLETCEEVCQFRSCVRHATCHFVAAYAREYDTVILGGHTTNGLFGKFSEGEGRAWCRHETIAWKGEVEEFPRVEIDVAAGSATFFLYLVEIGTFVPVGFGVIVVRKRVEP